MSNSALKVFRALRDITRAALASRVPIALNDEHFRFMVDLNGRRHYTNSERRWNFHYLVAKRVGAKGKYYAWVDSAPGINDTPRYVLRREL